MSDYYQIILRTPGILSEIWKNGEKMENVVEVHVDADLYDPPRIFLTLEGDDIDIWTGDNE